MTPKPTRIVDAHVHLWDPERFDWYPYIGTIASHGAGDPSRVNRRFDVEAYRSETRNWNVEKIVNVAAATGRSSIDETIELDARADAGSGPDAIIGGLPPSRSVAEAVEMLDRQMSAKRFRGIRPMGGLDKPVPPREVLAALEERGLVFELMTHPDQLVAAARQLEGADGLSVVVEHTGWPRENTDEEVALWTTGMDALASLGDHVTCKLSGLAMPFESMRAEVLGPWLEHAIGVFGTDRCLFASNFPVDAKAGTFDELYGTFDEVTAGLSEDDRDKLFAANAERVYRC